MTFNIRMANKGDKENYWDHRKEYAGGLIRFYEPDLIGMQEVLHQQLTDLCEELPDYTYIGVGRLDGKTKGEYAPIFYKKDRFKLLDSGNFWLHENPQTVGEKGWDAACERVATWGLFEEKASKKRFLFLNTHLDHVGKIARREGAKLILKEVDRLAQQYSAIVTGDFNATADEEPIEILIQGNATQKLINSRSVATLKYGPEWSFHDFGQLPVEQRSLIDYIFLKGTWEVSKHGILSEHKGILYPSDHCPVISALYLK